MNLPPKQKNTFSRVDFVIITALPEERNAVLAQLPGYQKLAPEEGHIRTFYRAELPVTFSDNSTGTYQIIVMCLIGMGQVQAVSAAKDAIYRWKPRYVIMTGIAGGLKDRKIDLGDILISDQVVFYELQKLEEQGPKIRYVVHQVNQRLLEGCIHFLDESWVEQIGIKRPAEGTPELHFGPIASGDKVIARSDVLAQYQDDWPKLIGVEMEGAGVSTAAFQSSEPPGFFMVRGVSDLADKDKDTVDVQAWRTYACHAAAAFAISFLKSGPVPIIEEGDYFTATRIAWRLDDTPEQLLAAGIAAALTPFLPYLTASGALASKGLLDEIGGMAVTEVERLLGRMVLNDQVNQVVESSRKLVSERQAAPLILETTIKETIPDLFRQDPMLKNDAQAIYREVARNMVVRSAQPNRWTMPGLDVKLSEESDLLKAANQLRFVIEKTPENERPLGMSLLYELISNYLSSQPLPPSEESSLFRLKFDDRQKIMGDIRNEGHSSRVFELTGPSGIGKKYILQALQDENDRKQQEISLETWGFWRYAMVDCRQVTTYEAIMDVLTSQLGGYGPVPTPEERLAEALMELSYKAKAGQRIHVLFLLDNAEWLSDEVLSWLAGKGGKGPVGDSIRNKFPSSKKFFLRLVLNTRCPRLNQTFCMRHGLTNISTQIIEPLDAKTVNHILCDLYESHTHVLDFDPGWDVNVVRELMEMSGGYPRAICELLQKLDSRDYTRLNDGSFFNDCRSRVLGIIKRDVIGDLTLRQYYLLVVLSFFRWFSPYYIDKLINDGLLPQNILPDGDSNLPGKQGLIHRRLNFLEDTGLAQRGNGDLNQSHLVHPILQPTLQTHMVKDSSLLLTQLLRECFEIYDEVLVARDGAGMPETPLNPRALLTLEAMYHFIKWQTRAGSGKEICQAVVSLARYYRDLYDQTIQVNRDITADPEKLQNLWNEDEPLHALIKRLDQCQKLFETLHEIFTAPVLQTSELILQRSST